ncbi:MAG: tetratricopeptide repeat protein [Deltaproteobacteria bacterium]|nr:tetratricopeptide repeat protein [Deltaproteobacteria bacterium]
MKKLRALIFVFGLITLAGLTACAISSRPAFFSRAYSDDLEEAERLIQAGNYRQAVDEISTLLEMDPKNEQALLARARAYQKLEKPDLAIQDYEAVLKRNPAAQKAHYNLGMIYAFRLNEPSSAIRHLDQFLSLAPQHEEAFSVAKIICSLDSAKNYFEDSEIQMAVTEGLQIEEIAERRRHFTALLKDYPEASILYYMIGQTFEIEGNESEAVRYYQSALEIQPTCAPCHRSLGNLFVKKRDGKAGEIHLLKAKLYDPNGPGVN